MNIEDLGDKHWSILLTKLFSSTYNTIARSVPFGEKILLTTNVRKITQMLNENGVGKF